MERLSGIYKYQKVNVGRRENPNPQSGVRKKTTAISTTKYKAKTIWGGVVH